MNAGAVQSKGDILFFLHCDSILPDDFENEIRHCMSRHNLGCFGVKYKAGNLFMLTNRLISNHRAAVRGIPFGDQGIFIDRELFFEAGMFPEIPIMEDYEFSISHHRDYDDDEDADEKEFSERAKNMLLALKKSISNTLASIPDESLEISYWGTFDGLPIV